VQNGRLAAAHKRFVVISACEEPWGGSEELWWAAACELRARGHAVSVLKTVVDDHHPRVLHLRSLGCQVTELMRPATARVGLAASVLSPPPRTPERRDHELTTQAIGRGQMMLATSMLTLRRPHLVVISQGQNFDGTHFGKVCQAMGLQYVLISQKASELNWPPDDFRTYYRAAFATARSCVFVSEHNLRLTEEQLGMRLEHAAVFRNPFLAGHAGPLPWPSGDPERLRLACVARLSAADKGQDLLLRVLAHPRWRERPLAVRLYGDGVGREGLTELARMLGCDNVSFEGKHADIGAVWRENHALVLSSRAEGLPLALVEAMMCGRPAIVTDVGGASEVVRDGITGVLASSPTPSALDSALERFWGMRPRWKQMGIAAAEHIRTLVPTDPGSVLADHLLAIAARPPASSPGERSWRARLGRTAAGHGLRRRSSERV
jgi:glycosyltransferase involved in cell wall biosynthesis